MQVRFKLWLEEGGEQVFGEGIYELLLAVERLGSINQAARFLHMSYRQAWGHIQKTERRLGVKLLVRQVGGPAGGGARLTPEAEDMLRRYHSFCLDVGKSLNDLYARHFIHPADG
ncbi:MAG: LysR family transcriptional regulator [Clostridia bacterium]|nr:MAG: LysR family transcriptional regulator [Clostridia bacterium]